MAANVRRQQVFDGVAVTASVLCLIHCLLLPVLIVLLPTLAAFFAIPEAFHLWALGFAVPASALALASGYRRHHRRTPMLIVLPGLCLLALGALVAPTEGMETALTVAGAILLSIGHVVNLRMPGRTAPAATEVWRDQPHP